ncbi:MAG: MBL fold metallo-hydrolase [Spirochaetales bacterium]|nr:MBL fold metallo-hydrolase [Spirochaetales bacterium]
MIIYPHFVVVGFSNSYVLADDKTKTAVVIDPGIFDTALLKLIEDNKYYIKAVLVTHAHSSHINGIKTLMRIYDAEIYAFRDKIFEIPVTYVKEGDTIEVESMKFSVIETPGHSRDSVVYLIDRYLFTGDTITAGLIGTTPHEHAKKILVSSIQKKLFSLHDDVIVFPGHGPPSLMGIERKSNPLMQDRCV